MALSFPGPNDLRSRAMIVSSTTLGGRLATPAEHVQFLTARMLGAGVGAHRMGCSQQPDACER